MTCEVTWEDKGLYWKYTGTVTGDEIVQASTSVYGDERFSTLKYKYVDFLDVDHLEIDKNQLALIAYQHRAAERANPYIKNAILLKSGHRLAQEFAAFFKDSSWEVKIFTSPDEADTWVGR